MFINRESSIAIRSRRTMKKCCWTRTIIYLTFLIVCSDERYVDFICTPNLRQDFIVFPYNCQQKYIYTSFMTILKSIFQILIPLVERRIFTASFANIGYLTLGNMECFMFLPSLSIVMRNSPFTVLFYVKYEIIL